MPNQYRLANACFIVAGALSLAKITQLATRSPDPTHSRLLFAAIGYAVVGLITVSLVRGVNSYARHQSAARLSVNSAAHQPIDAKLATPSTDTATVPTTSTSAPEDNERLPGSRSHPLRINPRDFTELYDTNAVLTYLKADKLVEPYIGKWILVRGTVVQVTDPDKDKVGPRDRVQVLLRAGRSRTVVSLIFSKPRQRDAAALFVKGQSLSAKCQISSAGAERLMTEQCEMVDD